MQQEKRSLAFSWARERADCIRRSGAKASVSWKNPQWEHTISSDVNDELASGSFFFFFRKAKKPRFLPMVRSVGRTGGRCTWSRTAWQQELQLHNRFPVNCFMYRFWRAAFWVTLPLPSQAKRVMCRQGISMCLSQ